MHSHESREEVTKCMLDFGPCWSNPPIKVEVKDYSNKPGGTGSRDWWNYGL
jgi:hypothetical protein